MIKNIHEQSKGVFVITLEDDYFNKLNASMKGKSKIEILSEAIEKFKGLTGEELEVKGI